MVRGRAARAKRASQRTRPAYTDAMSPRREQHHLRRLSVVAREEVENTLRALPARLRDEARRVPVVLEARPSPELEGDDVAPDTLGLFVGEAFPDAYAGGQQLPAQIILYLENIWDYADRDPEIYREELRRTLLHEFGHYLGLDEDGLEARDLD